MKAIGPNEFLLMSLTGQMYPQLIEETRLKPGSIWTIKVKCVHFSRTEISAEHRYSRLGSRGDHVCN